MNKNEQNRVVAWRLKLLRRAKWNVKTAIVMHERQLTYRDATARVRDAGDSIRRALFL